MADKGFWQELKDGMVEAFGPRQRRARPEPTKEKTDERKKEESTEPKEPKTKATTEAKDTKDSFNKAPDIETI